MKATWWNVHAWTSWTSENTSSLIMSHAPLLETAINYTHPPHSCHLQQPSFSQKGTLYLKVTSSWQSWCCTGSWCKCRFLNGKMQMCGSTSKVKALRPLLFQRGSSDLSFSFEKDVTAASMLQSRATKNWKYSCCPHSSTFRRSAPCLVVHQRCPLHLGNHSKQFSIGHRNEGAKKRETGSTSF